LSQSLVSAERKIKETLALARRHSSPATNPGAHALANKIIQILEEPWPIILRKSACRSCGR